jgi:hypothetical protein
MVMLWTIRHKWPAGAKFSFNCYQYWVILMIWNKGAAAVFLYSRERE